MKSYETHDVSLQLNLVKVWFVMVLGREDTPYPNLKIKSKTLDVKLPQIIFFKNVIIGIGRIKAVRWPFRSYIVRVEQNGLYSLCCGR